LFKVAKGKSPEKKILQNVWGEAGNETTAIMGPSGSGKTSLLNVLSGRARNLGRLKVTADVKLDGKSVDPTDVSVRQHIAFVEQDDTLCISATPREAIFFSAKLRLPKSYMDEQLHTLTDRMLTELGLQGCADTIIGGTLTKGISGGERKRTSVGVELVTQPSIVFLDEPTSGLDSFSALQLVQVLDKVARAGASVLFTIHQPQSDIFDMFDCMILMNKGQVMYQGDVENMTDYFESRGHPLPPKYNPADYVMIVAQTIPEKELKEAGFFSERKEADSSSERSVMEYNPKNEHNRHVGAWIQVKYLVQRDFQSLVRVKTILGARLALTGFMTVLTGFIFWQVGDGNLEDRVVRKHSRDSATTCKKSNHLNESLIFPGGAKHFWWSCHGLYACHVWFRHANSDCLSRGTSCLLERVRHKSLFRCFVLLVKASAGSNFDSDSNGSIGKQRLYGCDTSTALCLDHLHKPLTTSTGNLELLYDGAQPRLWFVFHHSIHFGNVQYRIGHGYWFDCGGS
jgi:ABC-type multidrug transport system ATPase subunit